MAKHGKTEKHIESLFSKSGKFTFEGVEYIILNIGKPSPSKGECKTDIYILCKDSNGKEREFKISIKQHDADFLENKMSHERAVEIFGDDADSILEKSINSVKKGFEDEPLVNFSRYKTTEANCIKIGWKFEFVNKPSGTRAGEIRLTKEQKIDVYAGSNLSSEKKDSKVHGITIKNSGIANYILEVEDLTQELDYYLSRLIPINEFAVSQTIYFACKAINYRVDADKWDGDRPLSVWCAWSFDKDGKLDGKLVYDKPLGKKANEIGNNIRELLTGLKLNKTNFPEIKAKISTSVKLHE